MIFITNYQHEKCKNVELSHEGPVLVEKSGYITLKKQIEQLLDAGENLHDARLKNYAYTDYVDIDQAVVPPSSQPNFDLVDAQREYDAALRRITEARQKAAQTNKEPLKTQEPTKVEPKAGETSPPQPGATSSAATELK